MKSFLSVNQLTSLRRCMSTNITVTTLARPVQTRKIIEENPETIQTAPRDPTFDIVSSTTEGMIKNKVKIFRPAPSAMQSGKNNSRHWQIDFDVLQYGDRWENQLMGWKGSADPMQSIRMKFASKENAIDYAKRQGWEYTVAEPNFPKFKVKTYKENFSYNPSKLRFIYTK